LGHVPSRAEPGPGPTVILYVRHGTTPTTGRVLPGQGGGLHLSDQGRAEAARAGERLAALPAGTVSAIYASSLERAQETATALGSALGLPVQTEPDLMDCDTGEWTGLELKAVRKLPEWRNLELWPSGFRFPGGESTAEVQSRVTAVTERLRRAHPGAVVVAVSHADPIKLAVVSALGMPPDLNERVVISPCSITAITYAPGAVAVLTVNSTADLRGLGLVRHEDGKAKE